MGSYRWAKDLAAGSLRATYPELDVDSGEGRGKILFRKVCEVPGRSDENFEIDMRPNDRFSQLFIHKFGIYFFASAGVLAALFLIFSLLKKEVDRQLSNALLIQLGIRDGSERSWSARIFSFLPGLNQSRSEFKELNRKLHSEFERTATLQSALVSRRTFVKYMHDIRSPLGALQILFQKNREKFHYEEQAMLDQILMRLKEIPEKMLITEKTARVQKALKLEDLPYLTQLTTERLNVEFGETCKVYLDKGYENLTSCELPVSMSGLDRVLTNLCTNAKQAGASEVRIRVDIERDQIEICISDNGPGGFDLMKPIKSKSGYGLGLEIVREIIESAGGSISSQSLASGTQIRLSIKVTTENPIN
jgi:signal transduction histidine kinase